MTEAPLNLDNRAQLRERQSPLLVDFLLRLVSNSKSPETPSSAETKSDRVVRIADTLQSSINLRHPTAEQKRVGQLLLPYGEAVVDIAHALGVCCSSSTAYRLRDALAAVSTDWGIGPDGAYAVVFDNVNARQRTSAERLDDNKTPKVKGVRDEIGIVLMLAHSPGSQLQRTQQPPLAEHNVTSYDPPADVTASLLDICEAASEKLFPFSFSPVDFIKHELKPDERGAVGDLVVKKVVEGLNPSKKEDVEAASARTIVGSFTGS